MNNTLYILCGLPYAGKTTLRKELVKRFGFDFVSMDEIMQKHGMWRTGHPTQEDWIVGYSEGYDELKKLLREKRDVILDVGNLKLKERQTARLIAEELGAAHKLIYINTPRDEIVRRRVENEKTKKRGHVKDELFQKGLEMFQEPTPEENPIMFNTDMNLDEWIKRNIESGVSVQPEVK